MTFGLKNAGVTYQRCIQNCFKDQIGRNIHAYVDAVVIKSQKAGSLIDDLRETFANLRRYNMKLNPTKCVFGVPAGKLLGFIVSERGIEANPEKIKAIQNLKKPTELHCSPKPVYSPTWRKSNTTLPALEEIRQVCVGSRGG